MSIFWKIIIESLYPEYRFFNEGRLYKLFTYKFGNITQ